MSSRSWRWAPAAISSNPSRATSCCPKWKSSSPSTSKRNKSCGFQGLAQPLAGMAAPQLLQRLHLQLPGALPRDVQRPADLFERVRLAAFQAEAQAQDLLLTRCQGLEGAT